MALRTRLAASAGRTSTVAANPTAPSTTTRTPMPNSVSSDVPSGAASRRRNRCERMRSTRSSALACSPWRRRARRRSAPTARRGPAASARRAWAGGSGARPPRRWRRSTPWCGWRRPRWWGTARRPRPRPRTPRAGSRRWPGGRTSPCRVPDACRDLHPVPVLRGEGVEDRERPFAADTSAWRRSTDLENMEQRDAGACRPRAARSARPWRGRRRGRRAWPWRR